MVPIQLLHLGNFVPCVRKTEFLFLKYSPAIFISAFQIRNRNTTGTNWKIIRTPEAFYKNGFYWKSSLWTINACEFDPTLFIDDLLSVFRNRSF
jgi:hypothetical protein